MNILVLSPSKKPKTDKTEYYNKIVTALKENGNSVSVKEYRAVSLELELRKAAKSANKPELIVIPDFIESEEDFRSKFAFIISRAQAKLQKTPNTKEKFNLKKSFNDLKGNVKYIIGKLKKQEVERKKREEYVTYERKKTHIFPVDTDGKTSYAFNYLGIKLIAAAKGIEAESYTSLPELADKAFAENSEKYPEGCSITEKTVKVTTFFERHFPRKGDTRDEKIRKSVMLAAVCAFFVAGCMFIYNMYVMPAQQQALQSDIRTIFYEGDSGTSSSTSTHKHKKLNWNIRKKNSDIKGWIQLNHTQIDYPVLQCKSDNKDSQFYLTHNYLKQYTPRGFGAIFIDYRCKKGMDSKNVVLHGHHMEDGSMFGDLMKYGRYSGNLGFYKKAPVIKLSTPKGGTKTYKIISVFKSNVNPAQGEYFDFYCAKFKSKAQFMNYVYNLRIRSFFNCPVNVNENDKLLTLVTCSYEFSNFRTVVVARRCRKNESSAVNVSAASLNKRPVWPACYYSRYGATRPTILTFKKALKKGEVKWYDGSARLSGSEQLPTSLKETTVPTSAPEKVTQPPKPTKPPKRYFKVKIIKLNKHAKAVKKTKKVLEGKVFKLPKIKNFKYQAYKYTFKKWKAYGISGKKFLSRKTKKIRVRSNIVLVTEYKKAIDFKKPKATKPAAKPKTKPTKPAETKPAEAVENDEAEE